MTIKLLIPCLMVVWGAAVSLGVAAETGDKPGRLKSSLTGACPPCRYCCPDDYCRKPLPCLPCRPSCGTCDNYCRKPIPCVPCFRGCWTCDDYCRKPLPCLCWPASGNHVCVSSCGACPVCNPAAKSLPIKTNGVLPRP